MLICMLPVTTCIYMGNIVGRSDSQTGRHDPGGVRGGGKTSLKKNTLNLNRKKSILFKLMVQEEFA